MKKLIIKPDKYGGKSSVVSARISDEMLDELDDLSAKTGKSRNELLVTMIEFALDNIEIDYKNEKQKKQPSERFKFQRLSVYGAPGGT